MRFRPEHAYAFAAACSVLLLLPALPGPIWIGVALLLAMGLVPLLRRSRISQVAVCALLGFAWASTVAEQRLQGRLASALEGQDVHVHGRVEGLPQRDGRALRFSLGTIAAPGGVPQKLRLAWYDPNVFLLSGECLHLVLRLKRPRAVVNPAGFDFERHALARGIGASGYVLRALDPSPDCSARITPDRVRQHIAAVIDERLPAGSARALFQALAIGDTRAIDDQAWDRFRATGTNHLVAISGLHIGLAAGFGGGLVWLVYALLPGLGLRLPRPQGMAIGALLFALAYAVLAGFTLPTQRSLIALLAFLAGVLSRRQIGWWTRYALAMLAVLVLDPLAPMSAGFWMSFAAVAWLILAFGSHWRTPSRWQMLVLPQFALALALLPLGLVFFQQASATAPLANVLAVPFVSLLVVPVILASLLSWPITPLGALLMDLAHWLLQGLDVWIATVAAWPAARLALPAPGLLVLGLALLGTLWLLAPRGWPARPLGLFALLQVLWPGSPSIQSGELRMSVLDVGQGQAVLLQTAGHALLIDTGPGFPDGGDLGDRVLVPSLVQLGVTRLDLVIVSHSDLDHSGGTESLRRRLPISRLLASDPPGTAGSALCTMGQSWTWDGVRFEILHPPDTLPYLGNESSCTVRADSAGGSVLIPGDLGEVIEQRLIREQPDKLKVDVLIAGHHGSAGSSSSEFLTATAPNWVLYSAGHRNRFGFPRPQVRQRVAAVGAREANTADLGALHVDFRPGEPILVRGQRQLQRRWWRE